MYENFHQCVVTNASSSHWQAQGHVCLSGVEYAQEISLSGTFPKGLWVFVLRVMETDINAIFGDCAECTVCRVVKSNFNSVEEEGFVVGFSTVGPHSAAKSVSDVVYK